MKAGYRGLRRGFALGENYEILAGPGTGSVGMHVRADGTVQLAPSRIKPPTPKDTSEAKPSGVTSGVIISKSMMGQRTDDENVPADWKSQRAPDFDWGR